MECGSHAAASTRSPQVDGGYRGKLLNRAWDDCCLFLERMLRTVL